MRRYLAPDFIICAALLMLCTAAFAASSDSPPPKPDASVKNPLDMQFTDTPLHIALDAMFKGSGKNYTLDPALQQFKVTAVLKNVSLDTALTQLLRNLSAIYEVAEDGTYNIKSLPQQSFSVNAPTSAATPAASPRVSANQPQGEVQTTVSELKYISAGDAAEVISKAPGVQQVSAANGNRLIIQATPEGLNNAAQIIAGIDSNRTLPKPIRLKLTAKVTVTESGKPKTYEASTESVGAEFRKSLLDLSAVSVYHTNYDKVVDKQVVKQSIPNFQNDALLSATVIPKIVSDGRISIHGTGHISLPMTPPPGNVLSKDFDIAASVEPGKPYNVASGSVRMTIGDAAFVVSITATPEEGYVDVPPPVYGQQGGYGGYAPRGSQYNYGGYGNNNRSNYGRGW